MRALCSPDEPLERSVSLARKAMEAEPLLDAQLADLLLGRFPHQALDHPTALRVLEVLDRVSLGTSLARTIGPLLAHKDPLVRSKAALVMGRRTENFDWLEKQLTEAEPRVRANLIEALWESRAPECQKLFALYRDDDNCRVAGNALYGLHLTGTEDAVPSVMRMASHVDPKFRATAAWLMGKIGQPHFTEVLKRMVKDENRSVKGSALKALVRLNRAAGSAQAPVRATNGTPPTERKGQESDSYLVAWQPEYSVGIDAIDREHQALVALIRHLQEAMWEGRGRAFQSILVEQLVKYTDGHLPLEEKMLNEHGHEFPAEHIEQHRVLTSHVSELRQKLQDGAPVSNASILLFLRNWFTVHITQHDQSTRASKLNA